MGYLPYQLVQDFSHQQYVSFLGCNQSYRLRLKSYASLGLVKKWGCKIVCLKNIDFGITNFEFFESRKVTKRAYGGIFRETIYWGKKTCIYLEPESQPALNGWIFNDIQAFFQALVHHPIETTVTPLKTNE